ncbi:MAG: hypothetical protein V1860_00105 [bacterium]
MFKNFFAVALVFIVFSSSVSVAKTVSVRTTARVTEGVHILNDKIMVVDGITTTPLYKANVERQISFTVLEGGEGTFSAQIIRTYQVGQEMKEEIIAGPQNVPLAQIAHWQPSKIKNGFISVVIEAKIPEGHKSPVLTYSFKEKNVL